MGAENTQQLEKLLCSMLDRTRPEVDRFEATISFFDELARIDPMACYVLWAATLAHMREKADDYGYQGVIASLDGITKALKDAVPQENAVATGRLQ